MAKTEGGTAVTNEELHELAKRVTGFEHRIVDLEEAVDTYIATPLLKRIWFALNGWPWYRLVDRPQWRPWHRLFSITRTRGW